MVGALGSGFRVRLALGIRASRLSLGFRLEEGLRHGKKTEAKAEEAAACLRY